MEDNTIMLCSCSSCEHQIIFSKFDDDEYKCVYCTIHLNELPFLKRLKHAIKYIFGYKSKYGDFDEFIVDVNNVGKLKEVVNYVEGNGK